MNGFDGGYGEFADEFCGGVVWELGTAPGTTCSLVERLRFAVGNMRDGGEDETSRGVGTTKLVASERGVDETERKVRRKGETVVNECIQVHTQIEPPSQRMAGSRYTWKPSPKYLLFSFFVRASHWSSNQYTTPCTLQYTTHVSVE